MDGAALQGVTLQRAHLQGASFWAGGDLRGALIASAEMQGADLQGADLRGASLDNAQLQGANLQDAQLRSASLEGALVWRARLKGDFGDEAGAKANTRSAAVYEGLDCPPVPLGAHRRHDCDWTARSYTALKRMIEMQVPEGDEHHHALERIAPLDPDGSAADDAAAWKALAEASPQFMTPEWDQYKKNNERLWRDIGCDAKGAPSVIRGTLRNYGTSQSASQLATLATAALDDPNCFGAR